jgi:hypothetical protein
LGIFQHLSFSVNSPLFHRFPFARSYYNYIRNPATMVRLRDIPRTATFAWSPGAGKPMVVTGTKAGAVDADFSDESKLELWDLALDNQEQGIELQPVVSITTESR